MHPDFADRHLGGDRGRRVRADARTRSTRSRRGRIFLSHLTAARRAQRVAVVLQRSARRDLPHDRAGHRGAARARHRRPAAHIAIVPQIARRDRRHRARGRRHAAGQPHAVHRRGHRDRLRRRSRRDSTSRSCSTPTGARPTPTFATPRVGARPRCVRRAASRSTSRRRPTTARSSSTCCGCATSATRLLRRGKSTAQHAGGVRARHAARRRCCCSPVCASSCRLVLTRTATVLRGAAPLAASSSAHRPRLHAGRDLADAAADHRARPPDLRPLGGAVLAAAVERHRQLPRRGRIARAAARSAGRVDAPRLARGPLSCSGSSRPGIVRTSRARRPGRGSPSSVGTARSRGLFMGMAFPLGMSLAPDARRR